MKTVGPGHDDGFTEQLAANPLASMLCRDIDRVLYGCRVARARPIRGKRRKSDHLAALVGDDDRVDARVSDHPACLLFGCARDEIKRGGRTGHFDVVDLTDGFGVGQVRSANVHGEHRNDAPAGFSCSSRI